MVRPIPAHSYEPIDLKLGIKSSLPSVKPTIALMLLLWLNEHKPSELVYAENNGDSLILLPEIEGRLFNNATELGATISADEFHALLSNNLLLKSQLEALMVSFELVWKLAKIRFTDGRPNGSERTGGARFPKTLFYSANVDLFNEIICRDTNGFSMVLYKWLGVEIQVNATYETTIINFLTIISESALYKLVDGNQDIVFNNASLYETILSCEEPVDVAGDKEAKGSLRILKSALSEGVYSTLSMRDTGVVASDALSLAEYRKRVETLHQIMTVPEIANHGNEVQNHCIPPEEQKAAFKAWMSRQTKANGQPYSENTINSYISQMERGYTSFDKYHEYDSVFQIQTVAELDEYTAYLFNAEGFDEFNDRAGNKACSCGLAKYKEFILENTEIAELVFNTGLENEFSRNRILFGAPGTGKSFTLNNDRMSLLGADNENDYERVTFHPDYSYANFVGTYKPVPHGEVITYEYVPGPFMRVYINALKNGRTDNPRPFLLVVEEINRANVAAVFGDVFQLLDRGDDEVSEYPIQASEDIKQYLAKELGGLPEHYTKIRIPDNMFIWATMNSADQGVFPMDTAFKRRWDFTYIGINASEAGIAGKTVTIGTGANTRIVEWNALRRAINERLSSFKINEDKLLGPYFLSKKIIPIDGNIDANVFKDAFKNKVLMYLFDDAAKQKRTSLFAEGVDTTKYSSICEAFDEKGVFAFCTEISSRFQTANTGEAE